MKRTPLDISKRYEAALQRHLKQNGAASLAPARKLGREAVAAGLRTMDLAKLHERTLVLEVLPRCAANRRAAVIRRAGNFFGAATLAVEEPEAGRREGASCVKRLIETLSARAVELAASNRELSIEIRQRKAAEKALKKSEDHYSQLLKRSDQLQGQMRGLSRQILSAHEDERKRISRELHDVVAQTLTGISLRLAMLKKGVSANTRELNKNIAHTQRLVEHSVKIVHQFARELRPAVLDDLGLIPALHSFLTSFTAETGIRSRLTAFAGVERLAMARRTVLFRVAQEALRNVARHSHARNVQVTIEKAENAIRMIIEDDGKSLSPDRLPSGKGGKAGKRLGILGMKERVEMIGGVFAIESPLGRGVIVTVHVSLRNRPITHSAL